MTFPSTALKILKYYYTIRNSLPKSGIERSTEFPGICSLVCRVCHYWLYPNLFPHVWLQDGPGYNFDGPSARILNDQLPLHYHGNCFYVDRKADLRELKLLQKQENRQYQDLVFKAQYMREQQEKKFETETQVRPFMSPLPSAPHPHPQTSMVCSLCPLKSHMPIWLFEALTCSRGEDGLSCRHSVKPPFTHSMPSQNLGHHSYQRVCPPPGPKETITTLHCPPDTPLPPTLHCPPDTPLPPRHSTAPNTPLPPRHSTAPNTPLPPRHSTAP